MAVPFQLSLRPSTPLLPSLFPRSSRVKSATVRFANKTNSVSFRCRCAYELSPLPQDSRVAFPDGRRRLLGLLVASGEVQFVCLSSLFCLPSIAHRILVLDIPNHVLCAVGSWFSILWIFTFLSGEFSNLASSLLYGKLQEIKLETMRYECWPSIFCCIEKLEIANDKHSIPTVRSKNRGSLVTQYIAYWTATYCLSTSL